MRTMLVTGASSGIGRALALRAARAGFAVYGVGRDRAALDSLATQIGVQGGRIAVAAVDVSDPRNARTIVEGALRAFGGLDVLVNNAGAVAAGPLVAQSDDALQRQFGTHVIGPLALVREGLDALRATKGHVFMLGSGVARVPVSDLGAYPASKAAIRSATTTLRRELRPLGIAVTYVDPGAVDTPFMRRGGMPGAPAALLTAPEDVARKILLAVATRQRVVNAVPWQAAVVGLADLFPRTTDLILERAGALVGTDAPAISAPAPPVAHAAPVALETPAENGQAPFASALEPVARRMEKLKLQPSFVRGLLVAGATLDPAEVALRWAGMPNKNERAVTGEVLDALAAAGYLVPQTDGTYRVVRTPEDD